MKNDSIYPFEEWYISFESSRHGGDYVICTLTRVVHGVENKDLTEIDNPASSMTRCRYT